jgi:hypothetical protein
MLEQQLLEQFSSKCDRFIRALTPGNELSDEPAQPAVAVAENGPVKRTLAVARPKS